MIEQLVSRVFYARNVAHFAHWRAKGAGSYARHMALGEFYTAVIETLDRLVEAYQGAFGLISTIPAPESSGTDPEKVLAADVAWIEAHHEALCRGHRAIANLLDGTSEVYLGALYKLRHLE